MKLEYCCDCMEFNIKRAAERKLGLTLRQLSEVPEIKKVMLTVLKSVRELKAKSIARGEETRNCHAAVTSLFLCSLNASDADFVYTYGMSAEAYLFKIVQLTGARNHE